MSMPKKSKMFQFINARIKVTVQDERVLVGKFLAFDKHMNVVLSECEEYRRVKPKGKEEKEEKRSLGLVLVRGENVVSLTVDGPLRAHNTDRFKQAEKGQGLPGPGTAKAAARGLAGPVWGVGGPGAGVMAPVGVSSAPPMMGRGPGGPPGMPPGMPPMGRGMPPGMPPGMPGRGFPPGFPGMPSGPPQL